jgi:hypothetical protein
MKQFRSLVSKGYAEERSNNAFSAVNNPTTVHDETPPDWIWLPNALVDGTGPETTPIELVRQ